MGTAQAAMRSGDQHVVGDCIAAAIAHAPYGALKRFDGGGLVQRILHLAGAGAGKAEKDRNIAPAVGKLRPSHRHQPRNFCRSQGSPRMSHVNFIV